MGNLRLRLAILGLILLVAAVSAVAYVVNSHSAQQAAVKNAPTVASTTVAAVTSGPYLVFRNTALGPNYGMISYVSLSDPQGPRAVTSTECDRVYGTRQDVLCLSSSPGVVTTYAASVLTPGLQKTQSLPLTGIPSRARLSADGTLAATTSFTAGDSYAGTSFSTRTVISKVGGASLGSLEDFTLVHDGEKIAPVDRNYWGVTFAHDDDTFYATVAFSGHTWLAKGSVSSRTLTTLVEDAECPSLSPDGTSIVYKQRGNLPPGKWRLAHYEISTGVITPLAETRSVDDQVEWLDNDHVIYGIPRTGNDAAVDDVYSVPADGSGSPSLLIPQAWSPAVVGEPTG